MSLSYLLIQLQPWDERENELSSQEEKQCQIQKALLRGAIQNMSEVLDDLYCWSADHFLIDVENEYMTSKYAVQVFQLTDLSTSTKWQVLENFNPHYNTIEFFLWWKEVKQFSRSVETLQSSILMYESFTLPSDLLKALSDFAKLFRICSRVAKMVQNSSIWLFTWFC